MTVTEWADCTDPKMMLEFLVRTNQLSERRARLFACACCRRVWHLLTDERSREAVEIGEQFADGIRTEVERLKALALGEDVLLLFELEQPLLLHFAAAARAAAAAVSSTPRLYTAAYDAALACGFNASQLQLRGHNQAPEGEQVWACALDSEQRRQSELLRDIVGMCVQFVR